MIQKTMIRQQIWMHLVLDIKVSKNFLLFLTLSYDHPFYVLTKVFNLWPSNLPGGQVTFWLANSTAKLRPIYFRTIFRPIFRPSTSETALFPEHPLSRPPSWDLSFSGLSPFGTVYFQDLRLPRPSSFGTALFRDRLFYHWHDILVFPRTSSIISINSTSSNMSRLSLMAITGSKTSRKREKSLKHQTLPRSNTITQMHSGDGWMNMPHNRPHSMRFKRTTSFGDTRSLGTVPRIELYSRFTPLKWTYHPAVRALIGHILRNQWKASISTLTSTAEVDETQLEPFSAQK